MSVAKSMAVPSLLPSIKNETCVDLVNRLIPLNAKSEKDKKISDFVTNFRKDEEAKRRKRLNKIRLAEGFVEP